MTGNMQDWIRHLTMRMLETREAHQATVAGTQVYQVGHPTRVSKVTIPWRGLDRRQHVKNAYKALPRLYVGTFVTCPEPSMGLVTVVPMPLAQTARP